MTSELFSEKAMDMILKGFKFIDEKRPDGEDHALQGAVGLSLRAVRPRTPSLR